MDHRIFAADSMNRLTLRMNEESLVFEIFLTIIGIINFSYYLLPLDNFSLAIEIIAYCFDIVKLSHSTKSYVIYMLPV